MKKNITLTPGLILLKTSFLSVILLMSHKPISAQDSAVKNNTENVKRKGSNTKVDTITNPDVVVKGVVKAKGENAPLSEIYVYSREFSEGIYTDANGRFEFPKKLKKGYRLVLHAEGVDKVEYVIGDNADNIEIEMSRNVNFCGLKEPSQPAAQKKKNKNRSKQKSK